MGPSREAMVKAGQGFDVRDLRAIEEAEGVEVFEQRPTAGMNLREHEEAQGVEVFTSPDTVVPATSLREGEPGGEGLSGDETGIEYPDDLDYDIGPEEPYPEA